MIIVHKDPSGDAVCLRVHLVGNSNIKDNKHFLTYTDLGGTIRPLVIKETPEELVQMVRNCIHGKKVVAF